MADVQIPVNGGTLPQGFCPTTPQEMLDGFVEVLTVTLPAANSTVKISTTVTNDDIGKLWVKIDADGNPLGMFIYDADVGDWVRATPYTNTVPEGTIWPFYYADSEANAKTAIALLGQENEPNPNAANPYWRLCDGTDGTPDLRGRTIVGAGTGGGGLTPRANAATFGAEEIVLTTPQLPEHQHVVGTDEGSTHSADNRIGVNGGASTGNDGNIATHGTLTEIAGEGEGHENWQPSYAVWYMIKTSRKY